MAIHLLVSTSKIKDILEPFIHQNMPETGYSLSVPILGTGDRRVNSTHKASDFMVLVLETGETQGSTGMHNKKNIRSDKCCTGNYINWCNSGRVAVLNCGIRKSLSRR